MNLSRRRQPLKSKTKQKYKQEIIKEEITSGAPEDGEAYFLLPPAMFPPGMLEQAVQDSRDKQDEIMDAVNIVLRDLGIYKAADMTIYDLHDATNFSHYMGLRVDVETRYYLLELLDFTTALEIYDSENFGTVINGFAKDDAGHPDGMWVPIDDKAKVIGHMDDGLHCPKCKSTYYKSTDILLVPNVSTATTTVNIPSEKPGDIMLAKSHMTLVAICPNCYCSAIDASREELDRKNLSPIVMGYDPDRQIIPLVPSCLDDSLDGESNNYSPLTDLLYWPKEYKDAICKKYQRDYEAAEENEDDY